MKGHAFAALRLGVAGVAFGAMGLACTSTNGGNSATGTGGITGVVTGDGGANAGIGGASVSVGAGGSGSPGTGGMTGGATGGTSGTGGSAVPGTGGTPAGGTGGSPIVDASAPDVPPTPAFTGTYHMGADISWVQHDEFYGATYVDTDGVQKDILALLKNHGFNSVRLRTFVDPKAADGYDRVDGFARSGPHRDHGPADQAGRHGFPALHALQRQLGRPGQAVHSGRLATGHLRAAHAARARLHVEPDHGAQERRRRSPTWCRSATRSRPAC